MTPYTEFSISPIGIIKSFLKNRELIWQLTRREVATRYRGSILGFAWSFINPLIMLAVYTFVFSVVFKARWNIGAESKAGFALALFIGLIIHGILAECMNRAPSLILSNVNYVKRVIFPLDILPWIVMGSALFNSIISMTVWCLFFIVVNQTFYWTSIFFPFLLLPLLLLIMGISWFLSSVGVFLRDVGQVIGILTTVLLFMAPVFYPASMLPEPYRTLLYLNPLTFFIEQTRDVLMYGVAPNWIGLAVSYAICTFCAWIGYAWFQKTRKGFADVL
jgi:lipopolysaccharide transport system permease protein